MSEFSLIKLGKLAKGYRGVSYNPEQLLEHKTDTSFVLLRSNNIEGGFLNFIKTQIVPESVVSEEQILVHGDIAVCMSNGSKALVGKSAAYRDITGRYTVGAFCSVFRPFEPADSAFLSHVFQSSSFRKHIDFILAGSAINNLRNKDVEHYELIDFNSEEKVKIANILDTLDTQIRESEAIIAKLQHVKQGLLHDLLTRGVDENGELRPSYEDAPHLYKPSELGWIPNDWDTTELNEVLIGSPTNGIYKSAKDIGSGALMIGQTSFTKERSVDFNQCRRASVSPQELSLYGVQEGNILVTRVFAVPAGVGLPTLVPEVPEDSVFESNMMRLVVNLDQAVPLILFELMKSHSFRGQVLKVINASNQSSINQSNLSDTLLPKIGIEEQRVMEKIILEAKNRLSKEQEKLKKQRLMKSGLMDDLLTGKVRVTELLNQEQAS